MPKKQPKVEIPTVEITEDSMKLLQERGRSLKLADSGTPKGPVEASCGEVKMRGTIRSVGKRSVAIFT